MILFTKFPILHVMQICDDLPNVSSRCGHAHRPRHNCPPIRIAVLPSCIRRPLSMGSVSAFFFSFFLFPHLLMVWTSSAMISSTSHVVIHFDRSTAAWSAPLRTALWGQNFCLKIAPTSTRRAFIHVPIGPASPFQYAAPQAPPRLQLLHLYLRHPPVTSWLER